MAAKTYETLFILDSNHYARDPGALAKQIEEIIAGEDGKVLVNRLWMEQKLAYPIDGHQKGTYWLTYFEMEGPGLVKIARAFTLHESIVRQQTIRLEPRLVEPILANARGQASPGPSNAPAEDAPKAKEDDKKTEDDKAAAPA